MSLFLRNLLFQAHSTDLTEWKFTDKPIFICPICGLSYTHNEINKLTIGHIWPALVRKKNAGLSKYKVLLCKDCNSTAGSKGDAQLQLVEQSKEKESKGSLLGERKVHLFLPGKEDPVVLNAEISDLEGTKGKLKFSGNRNNPKDVAAFKQLADTKQRFNMQIAPYPLIKPEVAIAGWITAAYLFTFYTFGYRYFITDHLNPIRQYIWGSFYDDQTKQPDNVKLAEYKNKDLYFKDPILEINIPLSPMNPIHLEIKILNYVITLPFHFVPSYMGQFLRSYAPQIFDKDGEVKKDFPEGTFLGISINCTKTIRHECIWDTILGKEIKTP